MPNRTEVCAPSASGGGSSSRARAATRLLRVPKRFRKLRAREVDWSLLTVSSVRPSRLSSQLVRPRTAGSEIVPLVALCPVHLLQRSPPRPSGPSRMSTSPEPPTTGSPSQPSRHAHSHSHSHSSNPPRTATGAFRASVDAGGTTGAGRGWASSPRGPGGAARPASELLAATSGQASIPGAFASAESESPFFERRGHDEAA